MNKILHKVISMILILAIALAFASCSKMDESRTTISSEQEGQTDDPDVTTITFTVSDCCIIDDDNLKLFHEELLKDGHKYKLKLKYYSDDDISDYRKKIETELKNGTSDVAFLGYDDGSNSLIELINSGVLLDLDDLISSDKGKILYEAFPKSWWEAVKINGQTYSIPNPSPVTIGTFAAFNKDYIGDDAIEKWDGSIEGIYEMIKNVKWNDDSPRLKYCLSHYSFEDMIGCDIQNGLLYDHDTMKIENPLESEKFINYLKVLEQMKKDGFMKKTVSYYANTTYIDEEEDLKSGKFLVVLSEGEPEEYLLKDNICIKRIPPWFSSQIAASIGISKKAENLDAVIDFLGLLYGEEKYGNILLYGRQDVDYKLIDGYVADMDGTKRPWFYNNFTKTDLNLFINTHPVAGENFVINRKESYFAYYERMKLSPFIGFQPDNDNKGVISQDIDDFMDSLSGKPLDESLKKYSDKLKTDGMDEYLSSARKQWEEFHK